MREGLGTCLELDLVTIQNYKDFKGEVKKLAIDSVKRRFEEVPLSWVFRVKEGEKLGRKESNTTSGYFYFVQKN